MALFSKLRNVPLEKDSLIMCARMSAIYSELCLTIPTEMKNIDLEKDVMFLASSRDWFLASMFCKVYKIRICYVVIISGNFVVLNLIRRM